MEYCDSTSRLCVFIPRTSARPVGLRLPQTAWVRLNFNYLQTGVQQFHLFMHKWGLAPSLSFDNDYNDYPDWLLNKIKK